MTAPNRLSATELVAQTRSGALRVADVAEAVIARYEARDADVRAWCYYDKEAIRAQARALDAAPTRGPLHGVPLAVKDVFNTLDMPTTHNSPRYATSRPGIDAASVDILRASGALVLGKTWTPEFASSGKSPPTRNPLDLSRSPAGTSSGSAAAVADFQATISLGTQTAGSTIRPGSYNGTFAMKPTWNTISREGFRTASASCDTVGLYTRTAEDMALLADVYRFDPPESALPASLEGARIAIVRSPTWNKMQPAAIAAFEAAIAALSAAGATLTELALPTPFEHIHEAHRRIMRWEGHSAFLNEYVAYAGTHPDFKDRIDNRLYTVAEAREAYRIADTCRLQFDDLAARYDVVLTPSATDEAHVWNGTTGDTSMNTMWTILQVPVVNVPGLVGPNGMPIGISLVGRRYADRSVIAYATLAAPVLAGVAASTRQIAAE